MENTYAFPGPRQLSDLLNAGLDQSIPVSSRAVSPAQRTEAGFCHVGQAGLELLASSELFTLASQSVGIMSMSHHTRPDVLVLNSWELKHSQNLTNLPTKGVLQNEDKGNGRDKHLPEDSLQRSHTGRQRDSFGRRSCFAGAPARRFPVWGIQDGRARLVPSPQGKQQLEALRTESFTASTANLGRSGSVGKESPPKEN
ncbi:Protein GVQW1 [Plecturocebus cupreus]